MGDPMSSTSIPWVRAHGLSLVIGALFLATMAWQTFTGLAVYNEEQADHGEARLSFAEYLRRGHFWEATAENWESEFLQMGCYIVLTVFLFQLGSSESKRIGEREEVDRDPRLARDKPEAPWPVRRGGWVLRVYENSLSLAFLALFLGSFVLHAFGGAAEYN